MKDEYYLVVDGKRVVVSYEVWRYHNCNVNHIHYEANRDPGAKQCRANRRQRAICTGDCYACYYWSPKGVSVDVLIEHNSEQISIRGYEDPEMLLRCEDMIADMARIDPEYGERIGRMIMEGWQIIDIAAVLDIPVSTLRDRLRRIGRMIRGE